MLELVAKKLELEQVLAAQIEKLMVVGLSTMEMYPTARQLMVNTVTSLDGAVVPRHTHSAEQVRYAAAVRNDQGTLPAEEHWAERGELATFVAVPKLPG